MGIIITFSSDIFQMYKGEQSVLALNEPHGLENPWTRNVETVSFMDLTPQQEQNYENLQKNAELSGIHLHCSSSGRFGYSLLCFDTLRSGGDLGSRRCRRSSYGSRGNRFLCGYHQLGRLCCAEWFELYTSTNLGGGTGWRLGISQAFRRAYDFASG
jgi:hypothetical protein